MTTEVKKSPLLDHLNALVVKSRDGNPSLQDIVDTLGSEGHFVLITFLIMPFLQPIPLMGMSTPFGLLITFISILAYLGKPPWVPKRWAGKTISASTVVRIAEGSEKIVKRLSFIFKPRLNFLFQRPFRDLNLILLIINAILLTLPLPIPFSNAIPAWMILFQALAHLEKDGFLIILSYIQTIICVVYFLVLAKGFSAGLNFLGF